MGERDWEADGRLLVSVFLSSYYDYIVHDCLYIDTPYREPLALDFV